MTDKAGPETVLLLRQVQQTQDAELLEDLNFMFDDMRRQADILRRLPLDQLEESGLIHRPGGMPA
ncbi:hypothetical protein V6B08_17045 [Ferrovibrio sp. MS7]|uniref:hypothetical protein n=1 Tax=Ferrovibrio plantarum TaxID=3119164 RepID=UPI003134C600